MARFLVTGASRRCEREAISFAPAARRAKKRNPQFKANAMKRKVIYLAPAALGAALLASSAAFAQMGGAPRERGNYCATPVTICALARASWVGAGCSCRVPGYRALGTVASSYGYAPCSANPFGGSAGAITAPVTHPQLWQARPRLLCTWAGA
jgi:hypothetical protein